MDLRQFTYQLHHCCSEKEKVDLCTLWPEYAKRYAEEARTYAESLRGAHEDSFSEKVGRSVFGTHLEHGEYAYQVVFHPHVSPEDIRLLLSHELNSATTEKAKTFPKETL